MSVHPSIRNPSRPRRFGWLRGACTVAACSLTACTLFNAVTPPPTAEELEKQTMVVERAGEVEQNEITLLNVVWADLHRPRFFVDISGYHEATPTSSLTTGITGRSFPSLSGSISYTQASGTSSSDIAPLTKQDFVRGITTPVSMKTITYYSEQGFPNSLLLHLFVREIKAFDKSGKLTHIYINSPVTKGAGDDFDTLINGLSACTFSASRPDSKQIDMSDVIGPPLTKADALALETKQLSLFSGSLGLKPGNDGMYYLVKKPDDQPLRLLPSLAPALQPICRAAYKMARVTEPSVDESASGGSAQAEDKSHMEFQIRSPEAVYYYLGEIARAQLDGPYDLQGNLDSNAKRSVPDIRFPSTCYASSETPGSCQPYCVDLFVISKHPVADFDRGDITDKPAPAACKLPDDVYTGLAVRAAQISQPVLSVDYEMTRYRIPWDYGDKSDTLLTLTVLEQIIGLQTSAKEIPGTSYVHVGR